MKRRGEKMRRSRGCRKKLKNYRKNKLNKSQARKK